MKEVLTFRALRESKGLDVVFLARQFQATEDQIRMIERDSGEIPDELLDKYLSFFSVSYDALYFGDERELKQVQSVHKKKKTGILHLRNERPRFILAYFFCQARACKNSKFFWLGYIACMFMPAIIGFFVLQELPRNSYGYFYSWPSNLAAAVMALFLWRNIGRCYLINDQPAYFSLLERHFYHLLSTFLPALFGSILVFVFTFPGSNSYFWTNCLTMLPLSLNFFFLALPLFLIFLPVIELKFKMKRTINEVYPLASVVLSLVFMCISPAFDLLYGEYENLGIWYSNVCLFLLVSWLSYFLLRYRLRLNQLVYRKTLQYKGKSNQALIGLLVITAFYAVFFVTVYLGTGEMVFTIHQTFNLVPLFFELTFYGGMFVLLHRQARRMKQDPW
ncbi:hypothetical protein [Lactovum odontotermitis]